MSTITIHNKEYRIYEVTGKILESNKQRVTYMAQAVVEQHIMELVVQHL